jgi:hypothetical protein
VHFLALLALTFAAEVVVVSSAKETPAMQVAEPDAPAAMTPAAGVLPSSAAFVAAVPMRPLARSQCAGGFCQPAAQAPKQYQYQSRNSQPRRLLGGRIFGRR